METRRRGNRPTSVVIEADLEELVNAAKAKGYKAGWLINEALRLHLAEVVQRSASETAAEIERLSRKESARKGRQADSQ